MKQLCVFLFLLIPLIQSFPQQCPDRTRLFDIRDEVITIKDDHGRLPSVSISINADWEQEVYILNENNELIATLSNNPKTNTIDRSWTAPSRGSYFLYPRHKTDSYRHRAGLPWVQYTHAQRQQFYRADERRLNLNYADGGAETPDYSNLRIRVTWPWH